MSIFDDDILRLIKIYKKNNKKKKLKYINIFKNKFPPNICNKYNNINILGQLFYFIYKYHNYLEFYHSYLIFFLKTKTNL